MTVRAVRGFEDATITASLGVYAGSAHSFSTSVVHQTLSGYGGAQSLKITGVDNYKVSGLGTLAAGDKLHVAIYIENPTINGSLFASAYDGTDTVQASLFEILGSDMLGRVRRGAVASGALLATSGTAVARDTWNTYKVVATCREAASSGRIQVYLNGGTATWLDTGASVDCRNTTTDDFRHIRFGHTGNNATGLYFDDIYWVSSGETLPDEPLYIVGLRPNADGATVNSTPSTGTDRYAMVDENPISTSDYNEIGTAGNEDHLGLTNLSATPTSILCVAPFVYATGDGTITNGRTLLNSNGTTSYGTNQPLTNGGTYSVFYDHYLLDPDGSVAWAASKVNALLAGYEANT